MTFDLDCPSLVELFDFRLGSQDAVVAKHLEHCPRCNAIFASMPAQLPLPDLVALDSLDASVATRPDVRARRTGTGAVWRALPESSSEFAWVVVIIGRAPDSRDRVLVAPVVDDPQLATAGDLRLDDSVLGYECFVDISNLGVILDDQLIEAVAELPQPMAQALVALYRATLGIEERPTGEITGVAVTDEADPRLLAAAERAEALRTLWRTADSQVEDLDEVTESAAQESPSVAQRPSPSSVDLAGILSMRLSGPDADWNRAGLLEETGVDSGSFNAFLANRLDLTDKRDVSDLARVLHTLEVPWADARPIVEVTLEGSPGGSRQAGGPAVPMAARSQPGVSDEEIADELYRDQSSVDSSIQARRREITSYLAELRQALDELD